MTPSQQAAVLETEIWRGSDATRTHWEEIRTGAMREYVQEQIRTALEISNLGPEWYPVGPDHPFPCWRRDVAGEKTMRIRDLLPPGGRSLMPTQVEEPLREVLVEVRVERGVVLMHPTLFHDYLVAFGLEYLVEGLAHGRYLSYLRDYDGPGGLLYLRPPVYHGPDLGWSAGEIRVSFS